MLRVGLALVGLAIPFFFIGFSSLSSVWFEVFRLVGVASLAAGMGLLLVNYLRTPGTWGN